jgi:hypothetical protein
MPKSHVSRAPHTKPNKTKQDQTRPNKKRARAQHAPAARAPLYTARVRGGQFAARRCENRHIKDVTVVCLMNHEIHTEIRELISVIFTQTNNIGKSNAIMSRLYKNALGLESKKQPLTKLVMELENKWMECVVTSQNIQQSKTDEEDNNEQISDTLRSLKREKIILAYYDDRLLENVEKQQQAQLQLNTELHDLLLHTLYLHKATQSSRVAATANQSPIQTITTHVIDSNFTDFHI